MYGYFEYRSFPTTNYCKPYYKHFWKDDGWTLAKIIVPVTSIIVISLIFKKIFDNYNNRPSQTYTKKNTSNSKATCKLTSAKGLSSAKTSQPKNKAYDTRNNSCTQSTQGFNGSPTFDLRGQTLIGINLKNTYTNVNGKEITTTNDKKNVDITNANLGNC